MAQRDEPRQTAQMQQDTPVVFVDTHLTKLDDQKIKRLGLYTKSDLAELGQLLTRLHEIFTESYGLYDRQTIYLRLNGEIRVSKLVTELNFPEAIENENPGKRREYLFLSDLARITIGLAKTLYSLWQPDELRTFTQSFDELKLLAEWSQTTEPDYISEFELARNYKKIYELLELVTAVFEKQTGVSIDKEAVTATEQTSPEQEMATASVPNVNPSATTSTNEPKNDDADSPDKKDDQTQTDETDTNRVSANEAVIISTVAYHNLVQQFLDNAGINQANLPPELQGQLRDIEGILRDQIWEVIEKLSPEQREQLLKHNLRVYLYQKLLIQAQKDPRFQLLLTNFYQGYALFVFNQGDLKVAEQQISQIEKYFDALNVEENIDPHELSQALEKIKQNIKEIKTKLAETATQTTTAKLDSQQKRDIAETIYENLIDPIAQEVETSPNFFSSNVRQTIGTLENIFYRETDAILSNLQPEKVAVSLAKNEVLSVNGYPYQQVIIQLVRNSQFFKVITQFYKESASLFANSDKAAAFEQLLTQIENHLSSLSAAEGIDQSLLNQVLQELRTEINAAKNLATTISPPPESDFQPDHSTDSVLPLSSDAQTAGTAHVEPDDLDDHAIYRFPAPKSQFTSQQQAQLETHLTHATSYNDQQRKQIQDQSARVLWGTLAELFKDDSEQLEKLPSQIRDDVYIKTLSYIMSLSKDDIDKLRTSPSSLIRHIKNNCNRILGEAAFQKAYQQYTDFKTAQVVSRTNRIEKETQWAYQQIMFELFAAHNITDPTVPDDPGLQDVFDDLKEYLYEDVFAYIQELPTEDLINLYLHAKDRKQLLNELYQYLNADPAFVENLSGFYNNLLVHYEQANQVQEKEKLQKSLSSLVKLDGKIYHVRAGTPPPEILLNNSLGTVLKTDSKILLDYTDETLRVIVLDIGLERTLDLLRGNDANQLGLVFNLPKGMLTEANIDQFRSLMASYAQVRATQQMASAGVSPQGINFSGTPSPQTPTTAAANQVKTLRDIQPAIQAKGQDGDETVAQATNAKTVKEKRDIVMKIFGGEWNGLSQQDQVAVYIYYGLPFNEDSLKHDINNRLAFPFEYIDFRAKKDYKTLIEELSNEYQLHGVKNFNPLLKAGFLEGTPAAEEQRKINEMLLAIQAYNFAQLSETQKLIIAQEVGYATAEAFLQEQLLGAENALSNQPMVNEWIQSLPVIDSLLPADLEAETSFEGTSFLDRFTGRQPLSARARLLNTFRQLGGQKLQQEGLKKGAVALAAKAGLGAATGGLATLATVGMTVLGNKKVRQVALYGATYLTASTVYALSTLGGLLGGLLGSAFGFIGGPLGAVGGGLVGAHVGAQIWPQQWGGWLGFSPRQAPGWGNFFSSEEPVSYLNSSMQGQRAMNQAVASGSPEAITVAAPQTINATIASPQTMSVGLAGGGTGVAGAATTASSTAATSGGLFTGFFGMSIGLAAPLLAVGSTVLLTLTTVLVIMGAFIVPLPTRNSSFSGPGSFDPNNPDANNPDAIAQPGAEFVEITKEASVTQIENNTSTEVTYTVTVKPKGTYRLKFNSVEDTFSIFGGQAPSVIPQSPFTEAYFGDVLEEDFTTEYTVTLGADTVDAVATNNIIASFDVIDQNDFTVQRNQSYRVSESVKIGQPKVGCWPSTGVLTQIPYSGNSTHVNADAYDISAVAGTPVYAPFDGTLTRFDTINDKWNQGFGRSMKLTSNVQGQSVTFIFAHLQSAEVNYGETKSVVAGEVIGAVDTDGNSTGNHLHFQISPIVPGLSLTDIMDADDENQRFNSGKSVTVYDCRS